MPGNKKPLYERCVQRIRNVDIDIVKSKAMAEKFWPEDEDRGIYNCCTGSKPTNKKLSGKQDKNGTKTICKSCKKKKKKLNQLTT